MTGIAAAAQVRSAPGLGVAFGFGLLIFEVVEATLIGVHPLQALFAADGAVIAALALARISAAPPRTEAVT